ncbi:hypothetical protein AAFN87_14575 [Solibacillus sp. CAU 1738]
MEIKYFQDLLENSSAKYYGHLLLKIVGSDTIPVLLMTDRGNPLILVDTETGFETRYFRVEAIDEVKNIVTVTLLRPLDIYGETTTSMPDVVSLEKTKTVNTLNIKMISGVQLSKTGLLTNKMIIEPKW